jgi:hypothetical protein
MNSARKVMNSISRQIDLSVESAVSIDTGCIGVGQNLTPVQILDLATERKVNHLCQKDGHRFDDEVETANCIIESSESYRMFPMSTILSPKAINLKSERDLITLEEHFDCSDQKRAVLDTLFKFVQEKGISHTVVDDLVATADELFTNAIYNAPFVDILTQKNPGVSRRHMEIKLDKGKFARLFVAHDQSRLVLGCEDPYGSLDLGRYMEKIKASYIRGPAATMNFGPGGAGIGSYIIFNSGSSLYFGVWPGQATILCCVMPLGLSNRKRMVLPKHLHWIQR